MQILLVILGLSILITVAIDVLITTLTVGGGGPITNRLSKSLWNIALRVHRVHPNHNFLRVIGWTILVGVAAFWFILTWLGWSLLFSVVDTAVVNGDSYQPANIWERIYFTGFTLSTLGLGDYRPQGIVWQIATALASTNGFFLVTLSIAYLLPVISSVAQRRELAIYIVSLGETPEEILTRAWNGNNFGQLEQHLVSLVPMIAGIGERQLTYPVLHYFHAVECYKAISLNLVILDEALTLLHYGIEPACRPDVSVLSPASRATEVFLRTLESNYIKAAQGVPPLPNLEILRAHGIPTVSDEEFWLETKHLIEYRQLLLALVQEDGWSWHAVNAPKMKRGWRK